MSGTITLGATLPNIDDADALTIDGARQKVTVSGNNAVRVLIVDRDAALNLQHLTIANGKAPFDNELGGGVLADLGSSTLTVSNSTFMGNSAGGGAIWHEGVAVAGSVALAVSNSTSPPTVRLLARPCPTTWGGLTTISNSTFTGNNAGTGEVLFLSGATMRNNVVAGNTGANCSPVLAVLNTDQGGNLDDQGVCGFNHPTSKNNVPGGLDPAGLKDNGGPTQTIALCQSAGTPAGCIETSAAGCGCRLRRPSGQ
ncbi:MAG: hypothetical protein ACHBMF_06760 [Chromatiales bacterium]